jgi:serpin B
MDHRVLSIISAALIACQATSGAEPPQVTDNAVAVANASNQFGIDLYGHLAANQPNNIFFSPYSISSALAMVYAGVDGQTAEQMAGVLHFQLPKADLNPALSNLRTALIPQGKSPGMQLRVANRLWGQKDFPFRPAFLDEMKTHFGADLGMVNFKAPEPAQRTINQWVDKQTDHKIPDLIGPGFLTRDARLVVTNAHLFQGDLVEPIPAKSHVGRAIFCFPLKTDPRADHAPEG